MSFRINNIVLRATTASGDFGADLQLTPGLNIIKAPNTLGKSTCLQAVLYGLGLERMLGPRVETPFAHAMKEYIREVPNGPAYQVLSSFVELELENGNGEKLVIHRVVRGDVDRRLVKTLIFSVDGTETRRDFFLHDPGASQREDGFHNFLAPFLGWVLPEVSTFDGREVPLYVEALFPMLFVEQKRGWAAIQGPFPTFLKIQDIARRVLEYLIDLDVGSRRRRRLELEKQISALTGEWSSARQHLVARLGNLSRLSNIPNAPPKDFGKNPSINIEVYLEEEWIPLALALEHTLDQVQELEAADIQTTEDAAPALKQELAIAQSDTEHLGSRIDELRHEMAIIRDELNGNRQRVSSLRVDLARNVDAQKLERFGSKLGRAVSTHTCPTCHQELDAELLPVVQVKGMAIDENIRFIRSQIELYEASAAASEQQARELQIIYQSVTTELQEKLTRVRELGEALRRPSSSPTRALLERLVRLQARARRLESMQGEADGMADRFASIADAIDVLSPQLAGLKGDAFSKLDVEKIKAFEACLQTRLSSFSFTTFKPTDIQVSEDDFRPLALIKDADGNFSTRELGFEMSGSDAIRMKWSYYLALLDLALLYPTNHPRFLAFDEPDQQAIEHKDVKAFLMAATKIGGDAQIIVAATAEKISDFDDQLVKQGANLISFSGYTLQRLA